MGHSDFMDHGGESVRKPLIGENGYDLDFLESEPGYAFLEVTDDVSKKTFAVKLTSNMVARLIVRAQEALKVSLGE